VCPYLCRMFVENGKRKRGAPRRRLKMNNERAILRENHRNGLVKSRRRRQEIVLFAKVADNINHAHFPYTSALFLLLLVLTAEPHADETLVGVFQHGQGVGDGGGGGQRPQRRLPKAEVRYIARQKAHCHAKDGSPGIWMRWRVKNVWVVVVVGGYGEKGRKKGFIYKSVE